MFSIYPIPKEQDGFHQSHFSRRRALGNPAKPIQLAPGEKLQIALAIASPQNLGH